MDIRNSISSYDYQGNIVGVYNAHKNSFEQFTDYYPYGLQHASARAEGVNRRKFGGKELMSDHGLNSYDFAARYLSTGFPVFSTPDPLAEKYKHLSPHLFCAGDPINNIDPTGMVINMQFLIWADESLSTTSVENILTDLSAITGLKFFINNGLLDYEKGENGEPIISMAEIDSSKIEAGSATARNIIINAISSSNTLSVSFTTKGSKGGNGEIAIDPIQINEFINNAVGVDGKTLGYGMTFIHEAIHCIDANYVDPIGDIGTGIVVDIMNKIRSELNSQNKNYGLRMNYKALPTDSLTNIIPFDKSSFISAQKGYYPPMNSKYIKVSTPRLKSK